MSEQTSAEQRAGLDPWTGFDIHTIQASMQDEIDNLASAVEAQQRTIDELRRRVAQLEERGG